nr:retrovirus-related Pol polyprotein from transposon TNT 1-94 [Tanacetum cinerariifolium]
DTKGYGSLNCNGITFTKVAYVNGLKHNLISISQLCDANFKVLFTKTQGNIFNENDEVVLIAPIRRDVYVIDMSSYNTDNNACFYAKASSSVNWLDHLEKIDKKADDGFFLGYSSVAKAFRVFNIIRQEMKETFHVTFSEDDEAISQTSTEGDAINFNEVNSFPDDEFHKPRISYTMCKENTKYFPYVPAFDCLFTNNHVLSEQIITSSPMVSSTLEDSLIPNIKDVVPALDEAVHSDPAAVSESIDLQEDNRDETPIDVQPLPQINSLVANSVSGSHIEPKKLIEALEEEGWALSMTEQLNQFERNKARTLIPKPFGKTIIRLKWVFSNKMDEEGVVTKNKARLVAKGYKQKEGPDKPGVSVNETQFKGMIRSLMHLKPSRQDIQFSTCLYARKSTSGSCQILGGKLVLCSSSLDKESAS